MNPYEYGTHPCPRCGEPTDGAWSEGGLRWAICDACMQEQRELQRQRDEELELRSEYRAEGGAA